MPRKKAKLGDIFEIATPAGLAYVQFTHLRESMGHLVRVLPGLFETRPQDIAELATQKELYFVFYPVSYALRDGLVHFVSNQPIPEWAKPSPLMRWRGLEDNTGKSCWKILRASDELTLDFHRRTPAIRELTPDQKKLSIHWLLGHESMVSHIARGWIPEREEEFRLQAAAERAARKAEAEPSNLLEKHSMDHFLYFPRKLKAESAARALKDRGYSVAVTRGADNKSWLALAKGLRPQSEEEMEQLRDQFEALAAQFEGDYDGWETAVDPKTSTNRSNLIH